MLRNHEAVYMKSRRLPPRFTNFRSDYSIETGEKVSIFGDAFQRDVEFAIEPDKEVQSVCVWDIQISHI